MKPRILLAVNANKDNYINAVFNCGGLAFAEYCPKLCTDYDGLILCGGSDISPEYYGEAVDGSVGIDYERDKAEIAVAKEFIRLGKPILGICRGHQLINVLFGGTLYQHIDNSHIHRGENGADAVHKAFTTCENIMTSIYGNSFCTNSMHHQAVKKLGADLEITMSADDDYKTVEGLRHKTLPIFSVQWHPERMCFDKARNDTVDGRYIFEHFIKMCKA